MTATKPFPERPDPPVPSDLDLSNEPMPWDLFYSMLLDAGCPVEQAIELIRKGKRMDAEGFFQRSRDH